MGHICFIIHTRPMTLLNKANWLFLLRETQHSLLLQQHYLLASSPTDHLSEHLPSFNCRRQIYSEGRERIGVTLWFWVTLHVLVWWSMESISTFFKYQGGHLVGGLKSRYWLLNHSFYKYLISKVSPCKRHDQCTQLPLVGSGWNKRLCQMALFYMGQRCFWHKSNLTIICSFSLKVHSRRCTLSGLCLLGKCR